MVGNHTNSYSIGINDEQHYLVYKLTDYEVFIPGPLFSCEIFTSEIKSCSKQLISFVTTKMKDSVLSILEILCKFSHIFFYPDPHNGLSTHFHRFGISWIMKTLITNIKWTLVCDVFVISTKPVYCTLFKT